MSRNDLVVSVAVLGRGFTMLVWGYAILLIFGVIFYAIDALFGMADAPYDGFWPIVIISTMLVWGWFGRVFGFLWWKSGDWSNWVERNLK